MKCRQGVAVSVMVGLMTVAATGPAFAAEPTATSTVSLTPAQAKLVAPTVNAVKQRIAAGESVNEAVKHELGTSSIAAAPGNPLGLIVLLIVGKLCIDAGLSGFGCFVAILIKLICPAPGEGPPGCPGVPQH